MMENVILLRKNPVYNTWISRFRDTYSVHSQTICCSDFSAPTRPKRLFAVGLRDHDAEVLFERMLGYVRPSKTVGEVIKPFLPIEKREFLDHEWPNLKTIEKYTSYYEQVWVVPARNGKAILDVRSSYSISDPIRLLSTNEKDELHPNDPIREILRMAHLGISELGRSGRINNVRIMRND